ncbi:MAG TPA: signal peptidase II [Candidatus Eisenbacteria bacterium]|nr:signal peptidase II [Candidatus Eisenbacteria bacterium]
MSRQRKFKVFDFSPRELPNATVSMRKYYFLIAVSVIVLDRLTKWAVASYIPLHESLTVIPGLFHITHVENRGAAFGLFADSTFPWKIATLVVFSLIALIIVTVLLWKNGHTMSTTTIGLSLILGGATGNLWDRVVDGRVVDFLHFYIGSYSWPDFNVADSAIVIGAILLVSEILFAKSSRTPAKSPS